MAQDKAGTAEVNSEINRNYEAELHALKTIESYKMSTEGSVFAIDVPDPVSIPDTAYGSSKLCQGKL